MYGFDVPQMGGGGGGGMHQGFGGFGFNDDFFGGGMGGMGGMGGGMGGFGGFSGGGNNFGFGDFTFERAEDLFKEAFG